MILTRKFSNDIKTTVTPKLGGGNCGCNMANCNCVSGEPTFTLQTYTMELQGSIQAC